MDGFRLCIGDSKNLFAYYFETDDYQEYERKYQELKAEYKGRSYTFRREEYHSGRKGTLNNEK